MAVYECPKCHKEFNRIPNHIKKGWMCRECYLKYLREFGIKQDNRPLRTLKFMYRKRQEIRNGSE